MPVKVLTFTDTCHEKCFCTRNTVHHIRLDDIRLDDIRLDAIRQDDIAQDKN